MKKYNEILFSHVIHLFGQTFELSVIIIEFVGVSLRRVSETTDVLITFPVILFFAFVLSFAMCRTFGRTALRALIPSHSLEFALPLPVSVSFSDISIAVFVERNDRFMNLPVTSELWFSAFLFAGFPLESYLIEILQNSMKYISCECSEIIISLV